MIIGFADDELARICNAPDDDLLQEYIEDLKAPHVADDIRQVLADLSAAPTAQDLPPMYHYHLLSYDYSGRAAVDVRVMGKGRRGLWRMILRPVSDCNDINKKSSVKEAIVEAILENYHKGKG